MFDWKAFSDDAAEYLRDARRTLIAYLHGQDDEDEPAPTESETAAVRFGMDLWMRRAADTNSTEHSPQWRSEMTPNEDTLSIEQYRTLLQELLAEVERTATGYARRRVAGHIVTRYTAHGREMYRIVDEKGHSVLNASYLPSVYDQHAVLIRGPESRIDAAEPTTVPEPPPPPRLPAAPVSPRPMAEPMVLDSGSSAYHDRGWHPWD